MVRPTSSLSAATVAACCLLVLGLPRAARGDIIMTAAGLNRTLKTMTRLTQEIASSSGAPHDEATFALAMEAAGLASLMNDEVASHGLQEQALLNLALERTKALGIVISVHEGQNRRYIYNGRGFEQYLAAAPAGPHAAEATFQLLQEQFFALSGAKAATIAAAAASKRQFLARYPTNDHNADVRMFLAIDYRDLYRLARQAHATADMAKYRKLTRSAYEAVARFHPDTEQGHAAPELLRRFDAESGADAATKP